MVSVNSVYWSKETKDQPKELIIDVYKGDKIILRWDDKILMFKAKELQECIKSITTQK